MYANYQRLGTFHVPQWATRVPEGGFQILEGGFQILETTIDARAAANKPLTTRSTARELLYLSCEHVNAPREHLNALREHLNRVHEYVNKGGILS
jgi:hypothetical protein